MKPAGADRFPEPEQKNSGNPTGSIPVSEALQYTPALILIGGGAATGKSSISIEIVKMIPNAVLLDKDQLFGEWVDALLEARGHPSDRDCAVYWECIRPMEYASLERLALNHLRLGKLVVIDAPLRLEFSDPSWIEQIAQACRALGAKLITSWIEVAPECARERMRQRGETRDKWKLDNWDEFVRRQPYNAPRAVQLVLRNDDLSNQASAIASILAATN
jgi:predicted kinase